MPTNIISITLPDTQEVHGYTSFTSSAAGALQQQPSTIVLAENGTRAANVAAQRRLIHNLVADVKRCRGEFLFEVYYHLF